VAVKLFARKQAPTAFPSQTQRHGAIIGSLVQRSESLLRRYTMDPVQLELAKRTLGVVDTAAMLNARACSSVTLRLYQRAGRGQGTRAIPTGRQKMLASGMMGTKAAEFVDSANVREVTDHPVLDFVRRPNPYYGEVFNLASWYWREISGEFYSIVTNDNWGPMQWPGFPQYTTPVFSKEGLFDGVYFGRDQAEVLAVPADQVIYYRARMNRNNPNRGEGVLASQLPDVDLMIKNTVAAVAIVDQGYRMDGILSVDKDINITEDQIAGMYDNFDQWRIGGSKQGKPFIAQALSWIQMTSSPKDLRTIEQNKESEMRVLRAFGIPDAMWQGNASTYAGALVSDVQYGKYTVLPRLIVDADQKTNLILPMFGLDPEEYCFAYDSPIPRDEQIEWGVKATATGAGLMTINEARQEMGFEPIADPNADKLLYAGRPLAESMGFGGLFGSRPTAGATDHAQPVTDAEGNPIAAEAVQDTALNGAQIAQLVELARLVGTGEVTRDAALAIAEAAFPAIPPEKVATIFQSLNEGEVPSAENPDPNPPESPDSSPGTDPEEGAEDAQTRSVAKEAVDLRKVALAAEGEAWRPTGCTCDACTKSGEFAETFEDRLYAKFGPDFREALEDIITDAQAEATRAFFDGEEPELVSFRDQAVEVLSDQIVQLAEESLRNEITRLGLATDLFSIVPERAVEFARTYTLRLADDLMGTTAEMAKQAVSAGLEQGMSIGRIQKEMEGIPEYRAEMIARTETGRAMNGSRYENFGALGATHSEWVLAPGACPLCEGIAARGVQPLGDAYAQAGEVINGLKVGRVVFYPPAHPNDRCTIEPLFPEDLE
jgi:hypothetical protein